jgi:hypothetical protein
MFPSDPVDFCYRSSVLRLLPVRPFVLLLRATPSLRRTALLMMLLLRRGMTAAAATSVGHGHDVRAALEGLVEVADVARDVLVPGDGERDDRLLQ